MSRLRQVLALMRPGGTVRDVVGFLGCTPSAASAALSRANKRMLIYKHEFDGMRWTYRRTQRGVAYERKRL